MHLPKTVATLTSAALLAAAPVVATAADARPAPHHAGTHAAHHHDRLAGPRRGTAHAIAAQLRAVKSLQTRAAAQTQLADLAGLQAALQVDAAAVQADADGVATAASIRDLHKLLTSAITTRQVARLQFGVVVEADAYAAQATDQSGQVAAYQGMLGDQPGTDAALQTLAADAQLLADASSQAATVVQNVLALSATPTRAQFHAALVAAEDGLSAISDALDQVTTDLAAIQTQYSL